MVMLLLQLICMMEKKAYLQISSYINTGIRSQKETKTLHLSPANKVVEKISEMQSRQNRYEKFRLKCSLNREYFHQHGSIIYSYYNATNK